MLNNVLLDDKDKIIFNLQNELNAYKVTIEEFKAYDKEKTDKINQIIKDYNTLSELCRNNGIEKLLNENKNLKHQLELANKKLYLCNNFELIDDLSDDQVKLQTKLVGQRVTLRDLQKKHKVLKNNYNTVLSKLNNK